MPIHALVGDGNIVVASSCGYTGYCVCDCLLSIHCIPHANVCIAIEVLGRKTFKRISELFPWSWKKGHPRRNFSYLGLSSFAATLDDLSIDLIIMCVKRHENSV